METTNKTALKIGLVCALCAGIGAVIALNMNQYFWWVGVLAGGILGYLSYELPKVIKAVPEAWKNTVDWGNKEKTELKKVFLSNLGMILIGFFNFLFIFQFSSVKFENTSSNLEIFHYFQIYIGVVLIVSGSSVFIAFSTLIHVLKEKDFPSISYYENALFFIKYSFVLIAPFVLMFFILKGLYFLIRLMYQHWDAIEKSCFNALKAVFRFIGNFLKSFFLMIHSEARLICGVDSCLGALIGYHYNSPIIGALSGMILGIVNYYIVSIKILKLTPKI